MMSDCYTERLMMRIATIDSIIAQVSVTSVGTSNKSRDINFVTGKFSLVTKWTGTTCANGSNKR